MPRFHNINGQRVQFTADEETARGSEEQAWANDANTRAALAARQDEAESGGGAGLEFIAEQSLSSGNVSSYSWDIDAKYGSVIIEIARMAGTSSSRDRGCQIRLSVGGSSTDTISLTNASVTRNGGMSAVYHITNMNSTETTLLTGHGFFSSSHSNDGPGQHYAHFTDVSGTAAYNRIQVRMNSGNLYQGFWRLYGLVN
tara:strand:+ start:582 stop:1178 length:597 start_codon:yes stop_codon:yes gene_type:complete